MAEDSDEDKTEPASGKRLEEAKKEGNVPQSKDLGTFLVLMVGVVTLWMLGDWLALRAEKLMRMGLTLDRKAAFDPQAMLDALYQYSSDGLFAIAPFLAMIVIASVIGPFLMGGAIFSTDLLAPNFGRLNPMSGIGRMFSLHGATELFKAIIKAIVIGYSCYWVIGKQHTQVLGLAEQSLDTSIPEFVNLIMSSAILIVASLMLVVAVDVPFQLWSYYKKLRMSKQELKDEYKQTEGDPHIKGKIRAMQRQMAQKRMMAEVPKANVVVTNPTHYAVALKYAQGQEAPTVVAKGIDLIAQAIKDAAKEHNIPIIEAPPLARALYKHTPLEKQIPAPLFVAVAEVLAYVFRLNEWMQGNGDQPSPPSDLEVPADMDPGVDA